MDDYKFFKPIVSCEGIDSGCNHVSKIHFMGSEILNFRI